MAKHSYQIIGLGEGLADIAKDLGKLAMRGFGRILGIAIVAALFGGVGGGITAAVYGLPIIALALGGAVLAVIAVFVLWLLLMSQH